MVQFIQNFFLSPALILIILFAVFLALSWWAIKRRQEYIGYGLGWLIGVFAMVVYGALVGDPEPVAQGAIDTGVTLNLFQVVFPSFIGIIFGAGALWMVNQTRSRSVQNSIIIALLTAMSIWVLFLMLVSANYPATQRMIGLFALAFAIGAVTMFAIFRQTNLQGSAGNIPPANMGGMDHQNEIPTAQLEDRNAGNRLRGRIDRRR